MLINQRLKIQIIYNSKQKKNFITCAKLLSELEKDIVCQKICLSDVFGQIIIIAKLGGKRKGEGEREGGKRFLRFE